MLKISKNPVNDQMDVFDIVLVCVLRFALKVCVSKRGHFFEGLDDPFGNLPFANQVVTETGLQLPPSYVRLFVT